MAKVIPFTKMVGAGNDFLILEGNRVRNVKDLAVRMCDRTQGLGADGILLLGPSRKADYKMRIINADGSEAEMCGNGARCLAAYIVKNRKPRKVQFTLETLAGEILAQAKGETATVRLSPPKDYRPDLSLDVSGRKLRVHYIDTGVPHVIIFVDGLENLDVNRIAPAIRFHRQFTPRGTNVNFVEQIGDNLIAVRTYERGVEAETRACGTGSVAAAIIAALQDPDGTLGAGKKTVRVKTASGEVLAVSFEHDGEKISQVWLKGSARFVAVGKFFG